VSKFNPDFWEVAVERARLESFANEDALWHEYNRTRAADREARDQRTRELFEQVNGLIRTELSARQREAVRLYYFASLTEEEIGRRLGIPQQVVSQHLFGILRNGKRVGGAVPRLRKLCEKRGIAW
jgi:RNA polymerase sigma factor (sigma-70 family)